MTSPSAPYTTCAAAAGLSGLLSGVAVQTLRFLIGRRSFEEWAGKPLTSPGEP
jgi:hypothetical protein